LSQTNCTEHVDESLAQIWRELCALVDYVVASDGRTEAVIALGHFCATVADARGQLMDVLDALPSS